MGNRRERIAVVGAGVAGLCAAWRLAEVHDVVLYEREVRPGGHALTVDVPGTAGGAAVAIDLGFQLYHQRYNPNLRALLDLIGAATEPVAVTLSAVSGGDAWTNNGRRTPFGDSISGEISRFLRDLPRIAALGPEMSLRGLCAMGRYSPAFLYKCLVPMLSFWWVSRAALFDMPAVAVASGVLQGALSFSAPRDFQAITGGARAYVDRLAGRFADRLSLGIPVVRVARAEREVVVHDARGGAQPFDHVVLATDAATSLALLDKPSPEEQAILGSVRFESATLVVHRDESVMPPDRSLWCYGNYRGPAAEEPFALGGEMTYWQPRPGRPSVFVTVSSPGTRIDGSQVVARQAWQHMVVDTAIATRRLSRLQGRRRTWFCGGHSVGYPVHEHALCSGLAIAEALGARYPFSEDDEARTAYAAFKPRIL